MALPINLTKLLNGKTVEWERIEFKAGWNPLEILQSISAFANDMNNWGGGYIIVGVAEKDGQPILPPVGIEEKDLDGIQKELLNICNQLRPPYFPIAMPAEFMGRMILVIWAYGSETRPHQAPRTFGKNRGYTYFIRRFSSTVVAKQNELQELLEASSHTPYDDQIQPKAELEDLNLSLIQAHLAAVGSDLLGISDNMAFGELCRKMNIVSGPDEDLRPRNIGLLLFNSNPSQYYPGARIDVVQFKDESGDSFTEKTFSGPVQQQLQDALVYIKNAIVTERVVKVEGQAESLRIFNFPFEAIEEALVNTIYHRGYQNTEPVEVRVYPNRIEMVSYPGPLPPLNKERLNSGNIVARKYRNRRLGDFLKELRLTEGRGTGIPKIIKEMAKNGSPAPQFDTDDERSYFSTVLRVHPSWREIDQDTDQDTDQDEVREVRAEEKVMRYCLRPKSKKQIMEHLGLFPNRINHLRYITPLVEKGWLAPTLPDKPTSKYQEYKTTPDGIRALNGDTSAIASGSQISLL